MYVFVCYGGAMEAAFAEREAEMTDWNDGRLDDLNRRFDVLGSRVDVLGGRVDHLSGRVEELSKRVDQGFAQVDARFAQVDVKFGELSGQILALHRLLIRVSVGAAVGFGIALIGMFASQL